MAQRAVSPQIEHAHVVVLGITNIELRLLGVQGHAIGPDEVVDQEAQLSGRGGPAKHAAERQFLALVAAIGLSQSIGGIAEIDIAVAGANDIVGAVQALAIVMAGQGFHAAVRCGARDATIGMLAGEQSPLSIKGITVTLAAGLAKDLMTIAFHPHIQCIIRDIAEDEAATLTMPHMPLSEGKAGGDILD